MPYQGLTTAQAQEKEQRYGKNILEEEKKSFWKKFFSWLISPITLMLLAAAFLSLFLGKFFDFYFIVALTLLNFGVQTWQEHQADNAIAELQKKLVVMVKVLRDGKWVKIPSGDLVPDDVIEISVGDLIPADAKVLDQNILSINQSTVTGESLPQSKNIGDTLYSGTFVTQGFGHAQITATGKKTYFGKTLLLVERYTKRSDLERDILSISKFLMIIALSAAAILTAYFLLNHFPFLDLLRLDLGLLISGIPIALPTVMTLILQIGARRLAEKKVIVRRLSALENLANIQMLLTDKTGTLTENKISVARIILLGNYSEQQLMTYAAAAAQEWEKNAIDAAIAAKSKALGIAMSPAASFIPADSERKRETTQATIDGITYTITVGAPQIIQELSDSASYDANKFQYELDAAAQKGYRMLGVAIKPGTEEKDMALIGLIALADPLVSNAKDILDFMRNNGIGTKMITGDNYAIAKSDVEELGMKGDVVTRKDFSQGAMDFDAFSRTAAFAEVLPKDKLDILELSKKKYLTAMTGDGVNDIPAVKASDIGIAVKNAVDALKSAADIVLLSYGIGVIKDAFIEARKIFARLYSYSLYRISESFRLIITVFVLGIIIKNYPLSPLQLIIIAFLNDLPIISLAFNHVKYVTKPEKMNTKERFGRGLLFGIAGICNSLILFFFLWINHYPLSIIQTAFFLKLIISGDMLVYVAHTTERWWRFLPSKQVIIATLSASAVASIMAYFGLLMNRISLTMILAVWGWCFLWMQITESTKLIKLRSTVQEELQSE